RGAAGSEVPRADYGRLRARWPCTAVCGGAAGGAVRSEVGSGVVHSSLAPVLLCGVDCRNVPMKVGGTYPQFYVYRGNEVSTCSAMACKERRQAGHEKAASCRRPARDVSERTNCLVRGGRQTL